MALLNASQSGSFLAASTEPAAAQSFGGGWGSAASLCLLLRAGLRQGEAGGQGKGSAWSSPPQPGEAGAEGAGSGSCIAANSCRFFFCCWVTPKWLMHPKGFMQGPGEKVAAPLQVPEHLLGPGCAGGAAFDPSLT